MIGSRNKWRPLDVRTDATRWDLIKWDLSGPFWRIKMAWRRLTR